MSGIWKVWKGSGQINRVILTQGEKLFFSSHLVCVLWQQGIITVTAAGDMAAPDEDRI